MNRDQRLLAEAYESIYEDSLTPSEEALVKKAAKDIAALYFRSSRNTMKRFVLFKDLVDLKDAIAILRSVDDIKDFLYEKLANSLWDITFDDNVFGYRTSSRSQTITGTEENLEQFLYDVFSDAILGYIDSVRKVGYSGINAKFNDYIKTKRRMERKVDKELSKDLNVDLRDFS